MILQCLFCHALVYAITANCVCLHLLVPPLEQCCFLGGRILERKAPFVTTSFKKGGAQGKLQGYNCCKMNVKCFFLHQIFHHRFSNNIVPTQQLDYSETFCIAVFAAPYCWTSINSLGPIADISAQFAVHTNDDSGYIRIIVEDSPFMAPVQVVERG